MSFYESLADKPEYFTLRRVDGLTPSPHFHNALELVLVLSGEIEACINGMKRVVKAGEGCLSSSFDLHYYANKKDLDAFLIVVDKSYVKHLSVFKEFTKLGTFFLINKKIIDFLSEWIKVYKNEKTFMRMAKISYLFALLCEDEKNFEIKAKQNEFITDLFKYIHENYCSHITVESIAEELGYSRGYISTIFCNYTGVRFNTYVNRLRILSAKKELDKNDGRRVLDIAFACGFDSANTFYRAYKKQFGKPPMRIDEE